MPIQFDRQRRGGSEAAPVHHPIAVHFSDDRHFIAMGRPKMKNGAGRGV